MKAGVSVVMAGPNAETMTGSAMPLHNTVTVNKLLYANTCRHAALQ